MLAKLFGNFKPYLYGGIAILVLLLAFKAFGWFTGIQDEMRLLRQANADYMVQAQAFETERANNEIVMESMRIALETQAEALQMINSQFDEIRDDREREKRVLEGSRLGRLAAERAGLIESQSNTATAERFADFEGVINENF